MQIELGGGTKARGDGFLNVDTIDTADIQHDLNVRPYPFDDDAVTAVYSSHCLEHVEDPMAVLNELCRICSIGAQLEIRVPAPGSDLMFVWTHKHCWSPIAAVNVDQYFPGEYWHGPKRLKLIRYQHEPSILLPEARATLPFLEGVTDEAVMKFLPRTCHEVRFFYEVTAND